MTLRARRLQPLILCAVFAARAVRAEPSAAELSAAREAFHSAVALEADEKWAPAAKQLDEALAIKDTPGLRFHLAHCEERQGFLVEAALDYERATELLRHGAKAPDVEKLLGPASAELTRRVPHVSVQIPADVANPQLWLDGKQAAPSELVLGQAIDPGAHQLKAAAPGRADFERAFSIKEGERISIAVLLPSEPARSALVAPAPSTTPASPGPVAPGPPPVARGSSDRAKADRGSASPKFYLLIGESALAVAGAAVGIGYALAESSARNRVQSTQARIDRVAPGDSAACNGPSAPVSGSCATLRSSIDDHDRDASLSAVGFIGAGVGVAALVTTWFFYPSTRRSGSSASVQPVVALGRIGLRGQF